MSDLDHVAYIDRARGAHAAATSRYFACPPDVRDTSERMREEAAEEWRRRYRLAIAAHEIRGKFLDMSIAEAVDETLRGIADVIRCQRDRPDEHAAEMEA